MLNGSPGGSRTSRWPQGPQASTDTHQQVAKVLGINRSEVLSSGRQPHKVYARSLLCFWASRELGMSMVQLSKRLKISQPTASQSATRGEKVAKENKLKLLKNK